ncbi:MFS transporter [Erysipelothrix rhusiopathiae]|uniref:MFS transporter n=1 Tax=Erysipelothrix rhusiopathiae TaxID=1648 RepID=UPI002B243C8F|nr:MFS transporter [Erysipelothrix rhusiopathiae]WRB92473.1 MFS transporter [Erysipelothrix rhusiopathiae]
MKNKTILRTYFSFFLSGIFILGIGAIMPDLITNLNLSYSDAGTLLSMFAVGNLLSNFISPFVSERFGNKIAIGILAALVPLSFLSIVVFTDSIRKILWLGFILMGIGRGAVSILSNAIVNDLSDNKSRDMNMLHTIFAIGAGLASFVIIGLKKIGFDFNQLILFLTAITTISWINYLTMDLDLKGQQKSTTVVETQKLDFAFFAVAFVMFFYLGLENTINGWFMTYLKSMNILSDAFAATLVSLTWIMIMIGRLITAFISQKVKGTKLVLIYTIGVALAFFGLVSTMNPVIITISILGLGLCLAGIYPTSIANTSKYVIGNQKRLALLLTCAALGGIITPQIIGSIADRTSMVFAINVLAINAIAMVVFAFISDRKLK